MRRLVLGLWEFVVGDDWVPAVAVVVGIAVVAALAGAGLPAWWVLPVLVPLTLAVTVWRAH